MDIDRRLIHLQRFAYAATLVMVALGCVVAAEWRTIHVLQHPQRLSLHELTIVDAAGRPRVILAAPIPAPLFHGKAGHRDGPASGIVLLDPNGTERGGYITGDDSYSNAALTLDADGRQTMLLLAEPGGATLFRLWNADKGSVTAGVDDNPFLNLKQSGTLLFAAPAKNPQAHDPRSLFR